MTAVLAAELMRMLPFCSSIRIRSIGLIRCFIQFEMAKAVKKAIYLNWHACWELNYGLLLGSV